MAIIKKEQLIEKCSKYNLIPLEVGLLKISNQIHLKLDNTETYLKFASDSNFKYVYYNYTYYDADNYIIPDDWYSEQSKEYITVIRQHNQQVKSLDFDSPKKLTLFVLEYGTFIGIELNNFWIENQGIDVSEEMIETFDNKFYRKGKKANTSKEKRKKDEKELREIIFNDSEFKYCKNQDLRYWYLVELLEEEDMKKYKYLVEPYGISISGKIKVFMDKTWMFFKERAK